MSLLLAPLPTPREATEDLQVVGLRYVDTAVRLHHWSIPTPRCIHDVRLGQGCPSCDAELD